MIDGKQIGRYKVRSKLGAGGMGEIYLALDGELHRDVALKILPVELSTDESRKKRFLREARAVSALNHPNIITIHEIGESEAGLFMATELVDGETLRELIRKKSLSILDSLKICEQIASALAAAHEARIVHRDIKPENVMVRRRDRIVKVLDFGLAKLFEESGEEAEIGRRGDGETGKREQEESTTDLSPHLPISPSPHLPNSSFSHLTTPGMVMGSVRYMSPEQARGQVVDARTDIWSLGAVLYEMLAGRSPFEGATTSDTLAAVIYKEPEEISEIVPNAPAEIQPILAKSLAKDLSKRYQTAQAFLDDVKKAIYRIEHEISIESRTRMLAPDLDISENPTMIHRTASGANRPTETSAVPRKSSDIISVEIEKNSIRKIAFVIIGAIAVLSALSYGIYRWTAAKGSLLAANAFEKSQAARLESDGKIGVTAISPDGKYIAYASGEVGGRSLVVRQISTNSLITVVPPTPLDFASINFSPAGDYIYYTQTRSDFSLNILYQVPTLGGTPKKLVEDVDSGVSFSPDGKRMAFRRNISNDNSQTIFIAEANGSNMQTLVNSKQTEYPFLGSPIWSPDGTKLLVAASTARNASNNEYQFAEISVADGGIKAIAGSKKWVSVNSYRWLKDGSGFLVAGQPAAGGSAFSQIWRVSYPAAGEVYAITNDTNNYYSLALSADSNTLAVIKGDVSQGLWHYAPAAKEMTQLVPERRDLFWDTRLSQMPDGRLVFSQRKNQEVGFRTMNADGSDLRELLANANAASNPVVTPDGRFIVFAAPRAGNSQIWRVNAADGSNPVRLTEENPGESYYDPVVTPDGKWVVFQKNVVDIDKNSIVKVSIDGGKIETVLEEDETSYMTPRLSPDGKRLAATSYDRRNYDRHLVIAALDAGTSAGRIEKQFEYNLIDNYNWSPDSKSLTYLTRDDTPNLWKLPVAGGGGNSSEKPEPITDFKIGRIFNFAWARDGKTVFIVRGVIINDLVLIKNTAN